MIRIFVQAAQHQADPVFLGTDNMKQLQPDCGVTKPGQLAVNIIDAELTAMFQELCQASMRALMDIE